MGHYVNDVKVHFTNSVKENLKIALDLYGVENHCI